MPALSTVACFSVCVLNASVANNIDSRLLTSVLLAEGGKPGMVSVNKNGSHDLGMMQINTKAWLPLISQTFFSGDKNKAYKMLKDDVCFNISVGAWILSYAIRSEKGNVWEGVGRYHSVTPEYKYKYINRVRRIYNKRMNNGGDINRGGA